MSEPLWPNNNKNANINLSFGLSTPSHLWSERLDQKQKIVAAAYDAGYDHLFMADHVSFRNGSGTDGFVEVAGLSQLHARMGVMISIYLLPLRHPLPVARQLSTMGQIASGRMIFGVGIGGDDRHEVEVSGVNPATRGKRTNESLEIIRRLLDGETVDFEGEHFELSEAVIRPRPDPAIPMMVGGRSDAALVRAGRYAEGWIGVWCSPRRFTEAVQKVEEAGAAAGRTNVNWQHGYQPWVGIAESKEQAREVVKEQMERFYKIPFEKFERYTPYGTPQQAAEMLSSYADAGARLFNLKLCTVHAEEELAAASEVRAELIRHSGYS